MRTKQSDSLDNNSAVEHAKDVTSKELSLAAELYELEHATEAARLLMEIVGEVDSGQGQVARRTAGASAAVLTFIGCRLRDVRRAVRGQIDPAAIIGGHNLAPEQPHPEDHDVRLAAWSPEQQAENARLEISRAERRTREREAMPRRR
jgi:hypothetical protein